MKYALVTGGSRGIGRAAALSLIKMNYHILINYQSNHAAAQETLHLIQEQGGEGTLLPFDVSDEAAVDREILGWEQSNNGAYIEVLVNNAGFRKDNLMIFMKNEEWHQIINTHLNGFFYVSRRVLKSMLTKRYGRIINVVSLSGLKGLPGQTNYSAAKAGIIGATKALAQEVAARKVTVNAVAPGFIQTDMTADLDESQLKGMIPMGRFGKPEEVADVISFLASEKASYITGEVISVNGGLYT
jgi:3-oxoacyl-[acyl-carrier protein] reductase